MTGHARRGVDFQQEGFAVTGADHDVGPRPAPTAQRTEGLHHQALDLAFFRLGQAAWAVVLGVVGEILVFVVVIALRRHDADHRQRMGAGAFAQDGAGGFIALDELFAQHLGVVFRRQRIGLLALLGRGHLGQPDGRALARGLDDHGRAQRLQGHSRFLAAGHKTPVGRGQALGTPDALGHDLVHRHAGRHHTRAGVRNSEQLQRALHRAVFTVAPVQGNEAAGVTAALEFAQFALCRVERVSIHTARAQRLQHAAAGHQGHIALGRCTAHQHCHLAQRAGVNI